MKRLLTLLAVLLPTIERLDLLAQALDGKLDKYIDGQINNVRFLAVTGDVSP